MPPNPDARSPADQEYLDSVLGRQLMEYRNFVRTLLRRLFLRFYAFAQVFAPGYITINTAKFPDDKWVDIGNLRNYLGHLNASAEPGPPSSDVVRVKIEAPVPLVKLHPVKLEPQALSVPGILDTVKMRTLHEDGREVFELLSDSDSEPELDARGSDLEVLEVLRPSSRSSSTQRMDGDEISGRVQKRAK
jgi:hypothetical protein